MAACNHGDGLLSVLCHARVLLGPRRILQRTLFESIESACGNHEWNPITPTTLVTDANPGMNPNWNLVHGKEALRAVQRAINLLVHPQQTMPEVLAESEAMGGE